ncbi:MAG: RrF2 family transcriptional regulator [Candidatus Methylomirabilales bacterium]
MWISTKGDYATRALQELTLLYNKGPIQVEEIAERQGLPVRYLEQILLTLKRAGYVESKRGARGGYYLKKHPREITIGEIIRLMDGPLAPIFCISEMERRQFCTMEPRCSLRDIWFEVREAISKIVDNTTFQDLCERVLAKQEHLRREQQAISYHI